MQRQKPSERSINHRRNRRHLNPTGNVLIYVVVLMLIFGVLGVVMVSLFTSTTASTVTRNDSRRARYMAESGMRYAFSEMRKADFDLNHMINTLNTITYQIGGTESFTINVFSPWLDSTRTQSSPSDGPLTLIVPIGAIPTGYIIPPNNIYAINYEFTGITPTEPGGVAEISSVAGQTLTTLDLNLNQVFNAGEDERICLAVKPTQDQTVTDGGNLYIAPEATGIFPRFGGAFSIGRNEYFYEELIDDPDNNRVILRNLSRRPDADPNLPVTAADDLIILSPRNYLVVPTGTSDDTAYGGDYLFGKGIYDASLLRPGSRKPDITAEDLVSNLSEQETDTRFFETNLVDYELEIGGGTSNEFGSAFFDANMSIGGEQTYCEQGACKFALGVRVFFLLDFNQQGDGITFTLLGKGFGALGPPNNSASSVGGDFELSETMGYAGDSRLDAAGNTFLASNPDDRGLDPPKIAIEFDTRTNNTVGDPPPDYCNGADANADTRNDPLTVNKDAVQYVFWGRTSFLNIPCRDNNTLYDDNRHNADGEQATEEWRYEDPGGPISIWRPAIGPDGTIYMSALDATLYALNEDGSVKWTYSLGVPPGGNNDYMPGVDPVSGTVYSDIANNKIVAINPDGSFAWDFDVDADFDSTPVVGSDGTVYFGTDITGSGEFFVYALDPAARKAGLAFPQPGEWRFPVGDEVDNVPVLSPDGTTVYFVSNENNLYALKRAAREADPDPIGVGPINGPMGEWTYPIDTDPGDINSSPTVNPSDGTIYVGSADNHSAFAINPNGTLKWQFNPGTGRDMRSSPTFAINPISGIPTVYIGSDDGNLYALNANTGNDLWGFDTGSSVVSSPIVDLDGTIYVGSDNGNVYAINPDGTQKWIFPTGAMVRSSPAIGDDGFIHVGSDDTNFYTISQFADPRNFKDEDKSAGKLLTFEDLDSTVSVDNNTDWLNGDAAKGSWAVRLEVDRALLPNADGEFDYELRLWMRQCPDQTDFPCSNILGTFYQDTRIAYDYTAVQDLPMRQRFRLTGVEQDAFERFFFGFTGAAGAEALEATISKFQLSFIRPGDPTVDCDKNNWPLEDSPPLTDCTPEL